MDFTLKGPKIDQTDWARVGKLIGVDPATVRTIVEVETAGGGFDSKGRIRILYEPHIAYRLSSGTVRNKLVKAGLAYQKWGTKPYPKDSYPRLLAAMKIDETVALKSCSWGLGQIMGSNHKLAGYSTVQEMVEDFTKDEDNHLEAMIRFIKASKLDDELRAKNWAGFAKGYNGAGYKKNAYDTKLARAYNKWKKVKFVDYDAQSDPDEDDDSPDLTREEIRSLQQHLTDKNYFPGKVDGLWGKRTQAAVLQFQKDNDLPATGIPDDKTLAVLALSDGAPEREIDVDELKQTSSTIQSANTTKLAGGALGLTGAVQAVSESGVLDTVSDATDKIQQTQGLFGQISSLFGGFGHFVSSYWWIIAIAAAVAIWYFGNKIINKRVEEARTGQNLG